MTGGHSDGGGASWPGSLVESPAAANTHLTDAEVARGRTPDVEKHVVDCGWCSARLRDVVVDEDDDAAFLAAVAARDRSHVEAAWTAVVPSAAVLALASTTGGVGDVRPGELWTVTWKGTSQTVAVVTLDGWSVRAVPATTDVRLADEYTLLTSAAGNPLETPLVLWGRASAWLPLFVFDRRLGVLADLGDGPPAKALAGVLSSYDLDEAAPSGLPTGPPLVADDLDRVELVGALAATMDGLARAGDRLDVLAADEAAAPAADVRDLMSRSGLGLRELSERTGLGAVELRDAKVRGTLTRAQAEVLAGPLGADPDELSAPPLTPVELVLAASRPSHREGRRRWTALRRPEGDPDDPLPFIEHVRDLPVAARTVAGSIPDTAGAARQRHWDDRVAMVLATLPEP